MGTHLGEIWEQTLTQMEEHLLRPSFETWLKNTRPVAFYGDTMVIAVPNQFARSWVEDKYGPMLQNTLSAITDQAITLEFIVPASQEREREHEAATPGGQAEPSGAEVTAPELGGRSGAAATPTRSHLPTQPLNPRYTFDTFVVGSSNRLSQAACLAVAEAPARAYNPLFIYGGSGLGKTHLMQAIAHHAVEANNAHVVYISSETFANEMINAIRDRTTLEFRSRYRNVDVLLVDDIQFMAGKESTQEEFFHTFNALHEASRQLVISCDRPPKEIPTLTERLRSRFEWGLISDIQPPDLETRVAILRNKAQTENLSVPNDVMFYIAERMDTNIRELEGALIRLVAHASLYQAGIDLDMAKQTLRDLIPERQAREINIAVIQEQVAAHYNLKVKDLKLRKRTREVAFPRQVAMFLCREYTDASLPHIGTEFGGRDHTTVMHACERIRQQLEADGDFKETMARIRNRIVRS